MHELLHFVVDVDIKRFFENVNHGKLLKQIWAMGIRDKKLISIISVMLKAEIVEIGFPEKARRKAVSYLLCCRYVVLNEFDWWIASQLGRLPHKNKLPAKCE